MAERTRPGPDTVLGVLRAAEGYLTERGVDAPRLSSELLVGRVLGLSRLEVYLAHDRPMSEAERARLRPLIADRGRHVPLAYLLGEQEFHGLPLEVSPAVLIPRPETEHLVELARELAPRDGRVVDLGTGSGAIAVALAVARPDLRITAVDLSPSALDVARRNADRHRVADRVELVEGSWWEPLADAEPFDLLVSNPPYVDPARPELLAADVAAFEPELALLTPPGAPAAAYRAIVAGVERHLCAGGRLLLETGVGAAEAALAVLREAPALDAVELRPDLAGIPRYLLATRR